MNTKRGYTCRTCDVADEQELFRNGECNTWVLVSPSKQTIHIHFDTPVNNEKDDTVEAQWVFDVIGEQGFKQHPQQSYFVYIDFSRGNNSTFVGRKTKALYQTLLSDTRGDMIVTHAGTPAIQAITKIFIDEVNVLDKWCQVDSSEEAHELYLEWLKGRT
jgi:hypothetical protein